MVNPSEAMAFKANKRLQKDEELTIRYLDWMECKLCIRKQLKTNWHFDCICSRCQSSTDLETYVSSPKCSQCAGGLLVPEVPLDPESIWACEKCHDCCSAQKICDMETEAKEYIKTTK